MTDEQQEGSNDASQDKDKLQVAAEKPNLNESLDSNSKSSKKVKRRSRKTSAQEDLKDKTLIDALDLHELVQKNNGVDVDLEFYFKGKLMPQNTCFYEII